METSVEATVSIMLDRSDPDKLRRSLIELCNVTNGHVTIDPVAGFAGFTAVDNGGGLTIASITDGDDDFLAELL